MKRKEGNGVGKEEVSSQLSGKEVLPQALLTTAFLLE